MNQPGLASLDPLLALICSDDRAEVAQGKALCAAQGVDPAPLLPDYLFRMVCTGVPANIERGRKLARKFKISLARLLLDSRLPAFDIQSLTDLANRRELTCVFFAKRNPPSDLRLLWPISANLVSLKLAWGHVSDLSPLTRFPKLTTLALPSNRVSDERLAALTALPELSSLDLSCNPIRCMGSLPELPTLKQLDLSAAPKTLLYYPPTPDQYPLLSAIPKLPALEILSLAHHPLRDVSPLTALPSLRELNLYGTEITDLSSLAALQLRRLDIGFTYVRDLSPLLTWPQLKILVMTELTLPSGPCTESSAEILALRSLRPDLYIQLERSRRGR